MSRRTREERRRRILNQVIIFIVVALIVLFFFVDSPLRQKVLDSLTIAGESEKNLKAIVTAIGVGVIVVGVVFDLLERTHFLVEGLPKLMGLDHEERHEREQKFGDVPEDYVRRPQLEQKLADALVPGDAPRLVVLTGPHDTGKTTLVDYTVLRMLSKRYHGNIAYCRADLESLDREPHENDEHARRRLIRGILLRIIELAKVGGDIGESAQRRSEAIARHFEHEGTPWLIVIDQIDDVRFDYDTLLPSLYGVNNTVLVVSQVPHETERIVGPALHASGRGQPVPKLGIPMEPFSADEALTLLRRELEQRHHRLRSADVPTLKPHLEGTTPGVIQRLADLYSASHGLANISDTLSAREDDVAQGNAIAATVISQLDEAQRALIVALGLLAGETVGAPVLLAVSARFGGDQEGEPLLRQYVDRRYLELLSPQPTRAKTPAPIGRQRYAITKLGSGIARTALRDSNRDFALRVGACLLDFYRTCDKTEPTLDLRAELPNVLGMIVWARRTSYLPDRDVINFARSLRSAFYESGKWIAGNAWLRFGAAAATDYQRSRTVGDFASERARLLIPAGRLSEAGECLAEARDAYKLSTDRALTDFHQAVFHSHEVLRSLAYDRTRQRWLDHLAIVAGLLSLPEPTPPEQIEALAAYLAPTAPPVPIDEMPGPSAADRDIERFLAIDAAKIEMARGDGADATGDKHGADEAWRAADSALSRVELPDKPATFEEGELVSQAHRLRGTIALRQARRESSLGRWRKRRQGGRALIQSRKAAQAVGARYEEALALYESANLLLVGARQLQDETHATRHGSVSPLLALWPRWRRLQRARRLLVRANARIAALDARAIQCLINVALATADLSLAAISRDRATLDEAREYARGARVIADQLSGEHPALKTTLTRLPPWLLGETPAPAPVAVGAFVR